MLGNIMLQNVVATWTVADQVTSTEVFISGKHVVFLPLFARWLVYQFVK